MSDFHLALNRGAFLDSMQARLTAGEYPQALAEAEAALTNEATHEDAVYVLSATAFRSDRLADAIKLIEVVFNENVQESDAPELLAILNCMAGRQSEALYQAKLTTIIKPTGRHMALFGPTLPKLADIFAAPPVKPLVVKAKAKLLEGQLDNAIALLEQHMQLFNNDVEGLDLYSDALSQCGRAAEAIGVLRSVLTLGGPSAALYCRLGCCLTETGALDQALSCHAEALARGAQSAPLLSKILLDLERHGGTADTLRANVAAAFAAASAVNAPKTARAAPRAVVRPNICVAYLCGGDLTGEMREMVSRVALGHDRATVTTIGLGYGELSQAANICYRGAFDRWIDISPLDDLTLSVIIRGEGVDVLVDADGLMPTGRQTLFARNAAPLQISWLHRPDLTPAAGAHARLSDSATVAPLLLWSAQPTAAEPRPDRPVAFGADIHPSQLTPEVARVWSAILHAVPNATLSLFDNGLSDPQCVSRLIDMFGNFGCAHRIDLASGRPADSFLAECDIALAPFPAPSPTNYGKALSLGVPVITLAQGQGRLLANSIRNHGPSGARMVADSTGHYVEQAVAWAKDLPLLAAERANAAAVSAASPVFNPALFAAALEAHFRDLLSQRAAA